jgi:2-keto-4-pentenoate hydratase/2-oxohepta-3-ene-1,7-dioic acid hydratase in catechol pathway
MLAPAPARLRPLRPETTPGSLQSLDLAPSRVFALGLTYASHCAETGEPAQQVVFEKRCTPTLGPLLPIPDAEALFKALKVLDPDLAKWMLGQRLLDFPLLDYEVELGLVLLDDLSQAQLERSDHPLALGFFLANDITARTLQICGEGAANRLDFWGAAKSFAGFLPVSRQLWVPATASVDSVLDAALETRVNGELRQSASTLDLMFTPRQMLAMVRERYQLNRLERGTWLLTGTPSGIALNASARQRRILSLLPRRLAIWMALFANRRKRNFLHTGDQIDCRATGFEALNISSEIG